MLLYVVSSGSHVFELLYSAINTSSKANYVGNLLSCVHCTVLVQLPHNFRALPRRTKRSGRVAYHLHPKNTADFPKNTTLKKAQRFR